MACQTGRLSPLVLDRSLRGKVVVHSHGLPSLVPTAVGAEAKALGLELTRDNCNSFDASDVASIELPVRHE